MKKEHEGHEGKKKEHMSKKHHMGKAEHGKKKEAGMAKVESKKEGFGKF